MCYRLELIRVSETEIVGEVTPLHVISISWRCCFNSQSDLREHCLNANELHSSYQTASHHFYKTFKHSSYVTVCACVCMCVCVFLFFTTQPAQGSVCSCWKTRMGQGQPLWVCLEAVYGLSTTALHACVLKCDTIGQRNQGALWAEDSHLYPKDSDLPFPVFIR